MKGFVFGTPVVDSTVSVGLLIHRVAFGGLMLFGHGWGKLLRLLDDPTKFADPIGIGPVASLIGTVAAEFFCAALVILGLGTRLATIPLIFTMAVAALLVHGGDPLFMGGGAAKEPALIYMFAYVLLLFTGPGRFSLDRMMNK